jgi:hypothetical protein
MTKLYLLCPDYVDSIYDRDTHFITARDLAQLYKVDYSDCTVKNYALPRSMYSDHLIDLQPKYLGDYKVPLNKEKQQ